MVEGPGVHRVAIAHRRVLLRRAFVATSPSGRFSEGAEAINGLYLSLIEAHGKNIFYFFTNQQIANAVLGDLPEGVVVGHIHFGMSGSFRTFKLPGPEPRETTRLRLENEEEDVVAHLSASICVHGDMELYRKRLTELGPDPLRDDADKELAWSKMQKTKKSIGAFLMDQTLIAGIGNIYRAEILYVCGVHPNQRSSSINRSTFEDIWKQSERLLHIGVKAGSIITVSPEEAGKPFSKLKSGERRYIYNHKTCRRCEGPVINWIIGSRTCYACEACQPLIDGNEPPRKIPSEGVLPVRYEKGDTGPADSAALDEGNVTPVKGTVTKRDITNKTKYSTIAFRKRKSKDGAIVEHQALKDIPTGGLVDFPNSLDELMWPGANPKAMQKAIRLSDGPHVTDKLSKTSSKKVTEVEHTIPARRRSTRVSNKAVNQH